MHVRVRLLGKPDAIVVVESKLTKIEKFRRILKEKFDVEPKLQRLFYGGKLLEDGYTFHDYNIKLNDVIQLMVRMPSLQPNDTVQTEETIPETQSKEEQVAKIVYKDAKSNLYAIGDFIDMKDREQGAWFEGKIVRIVNDPDTAQTDLDESITSTHSSEEIEKQSEIENDVENKPPADDKTKKSSLLKYFTKGQKKKKKDKETNCDNTDTNLLYVVLLDGEDDSELYCKLKEIRPRARTMIDVEKLKVSQMVMINYNVDDPHERGYWYDFKVQEIKKLRTSHELVGTLYLGPDAIPQNDTRLKLLDKIFAIEEVVPIHQRTEEYKKIIDAPPEKRAAPLNCLKCRDDEEIGCKQCGCYMCAGKENPEKIVLCDECNMGYHMGCLSPPLEALPDDDWYCPGCRRDASIVVAPGAARQQRKADTRGTKDWGRGMACVGKTKTCAMPANHFGPIPGIEVGMCWRFRIQLSESGVHRPPVSGIHGRDVEGAYSIVLSGGYEDDYDDGVEFTYTGSGGRDLSGNKRTAGQSCDQTLTRENKALARNCAAGVVCEAGGDASEKWREGRPVRVVRSYKMKKHFPEYAPEEGIRYDGIYKVVKYYPERGLAGYTVWKYLLRRDDPNPAPWEEGAKKFPIVYPDGYLEAEAEKKAQKEKNGKNKSTKGAKTKKRALQEANRASDSEEEKSPPSKKHKANVEVKKRGRPSKTKSPKQSPKTKSPKTPKSKSIAAMFETSASKRRGLKAETTTVLTGEEKEAIEADEVNCRRWGECRELSADGLRKEFLEQVSEVFLCIICQEIVVGPVTTPCLHNFCMVCLKRALNHAGSGAACPCCRRALPDYRPERNEKLQHALRTLMPGYDVGRV